MNIKQLIIIIFLVFPGLIFAQSLEIDQLKTDNQSTPLGFDNPAPEFSWILKSSQRGAAQTAYEVAVSDNDSKLESGNYWQSGNIEGNQTFGIPYTGKPLKSFTRYFWKVRVWDENGKVSDWSKPSWFETSMMKASDWKAKWISDQNPLPEKDVDFYLETPNPLLRKEIKLKKEVKSARLYIAGLGYSIAYINDQRVGDHMLDMPWTQFGKQIIYNTFDVTDMLVNC